MGYTFYSLLQFPFIELRENVMTVLNDIDLSKEKMVDMTFITEFTGLSDKWFYKLMSEGQFPKPIKFGRSSRWFESEVKGWLNARILASRGEECV